MIEIEQKDKDPALLAFLDATKAFDRVEWGYIHKALKRFEVGPFCLQWLVYNDRKAIIVMNGYKTKQINISQGDETGVPYVTPDFQLGLGTPRYINSGSSGHRRV